MKVKVLFISTDREGGSERAKVHKTVIKHNKYTHIKSLSLHRHIHIQTSL